MSLSQKNLQWNTVSQIVLATHAISAFLLVGWIFFNTNALPAVIYLKLNYNSHAPYALAVILMVLYLISIPFFPFLSTIFMTIALLKVENATKKFLCHLLLSTVQSMGIFLPLFFF